MDLPVPWVVMWGLSFLIWAGCKASTVAALTPAERRSNPRRLLGYLFGWPGMNAREFVLGVGPSRPWAASRLLWILVRVLLGVAAVWWWAPALETTSVVLAGWVGMLGILLLLHFGTFDLLAEAWVRLGVLAPPLMDSPTRSVNLAEFWGRRWNRGFHDVARLWCFDPVSRRWGASAGATAVFLVSGLVHDLVITVPAGAGYGGPTAYFLLQAVGMMVQRRRGMRRAGWDRGFRGWLVTALVALVPVGLLFPRAFAVRVVVPFVRWLNGEGY